MQRDKVTPEQALNALDNLDDYSKMNASVRPHGAIAVLTRFILQNCVESNLKDENSIRILNYFALEYLDVSCTMKFGHFRVKVTTHAIRWAFPTEFEAMQASEVGRFLQLGLGIRNQLVQLSDTRLIFVTIIIRHSFIPLLVERY